MPAIARLLFEKDTVGSYSPPTNAGRQDAQFNGHPKDGRDRKDAHTMEIDVDLSAQFVCKKTDCSRCQLA